MPTPEQSQIAAGLSQDAFWIHASGQYVQFRVAAVDHEGRTVEFTAPLAFVSNDKGVNAPSATTIVNQAWKEPVDPLKPPRPSRTCAIGGQAVAFAPHALPNDTTLETQSINLGAEAKKIDAAAKPLFRPTVTEAQVDIPAVKQLLGTNAQCVTPSQYEATFT